MALTPREEHAAELVGLLTKHVPGYDGWGRMQSCACNVIVRSYAAWVLHVVTQFTHPGLTADNVHLSAVRNPADPPEADAGPVGETAPDGVGGPPAVKDAAKLIEKARQQVGDIADRSMREQLIADLANALASAVSADETPRAARGTMGRSPSEDLPTGGAPWRLPENDPPVGGAPWRLVVLPVMPACNRLAVHVVSPSRAPFSVHTCAEHRADAEQGWEFGATTSWSSPIARTMCGCWVGRFLTLEEKPAPPDGGLVQEPGDSAAGDAR